MTYASCRCGSDPPPGGYSTVMTSSSLPAMSASCSVRSCTTIASAGFVPAGALWDTPARTLTRQRAANRLMFERCIRGPYAGGAAGTTIVTIQLPAQTYSHADPRVDCPLLAPGGGHSVHASRLNRPGAGREPGQYADRLDGTGSEAHNDRRQDHRSWQPVWPQGGLP